MQIDPLTHARRWKILFTLSLSLLMVSMDVTILHTAMPKIISDLQPNALQQLWIVNAYALILAGLLITTGAWGDRTGRKRLLNLGLIIFMLASFSAAFINQPWSLAICRAFLGVGGAMIMPSTLSLLRNVFIDPHERTTAIALWGIMASLGATIGPVLGGILIEFFDWHAAFLINIPFALLALLLGVKLLPESFTPSQAPWDWLGVGQSFIGMAALVQGIKLLGKLGFLSWQTIGFLFCGIIFLAFFITRQCQLKDPLIDAKLFKNSAFSTGILIYLLATCALGSVLYLISQWFQFVKEMRPLEAGLWLMPATLSGLLTGFIIPIILKHFSARNIMVLGLFFISFSLLVPSLLPTVTLFFTAIYLALMGIGVNLTLSTAVAVVMSRVPPERAGGAAAIQETAFELGNVLGIAVIGSLTAALYRKALIIPEEISSKIADIAKSSIGESTIVAQNLPPQLGKTLQQAANTAFDYAFGISGIILGAILLLAGIAILFLLPSFKASSAHH